MCRTIQLTGIRMYIIIISIFIVIIIIIIIVIIMFHPEVLSHIVGLLLGVLVRRHIILLF
jgi:hypothetical protein